MDMLLIATLVFLVVLVVAAAVGWRVLAVAAGVAAVAATALGAAIRDRAFTGGGEEEDPQVEPLQASATTYFHGEEVAEAMVPYLEAVAAAPQAKVQTLLSELVVGPPFETFRPRVSAVLHYGQRKLLMSEVGFMTRHGHRSKEVVYVGAAPGTHVPYLASLFPTHKFTLYDTGHFLLFGHPETKGQITVEHRYFTDEDAKALAGKGVLFISDIRTGVTDMDAGEAVATDMAMQRGWVELVRPAATSLKFRLPWNEMETEYFAGALYTQAWAPGATSETRMEFEGVPPMKLWKNKEYDRRVHFLNSGLRQWASYKGKLPEVPGVDRCFDCAREIAAWEAYRKALKTKTPVATLMAGATEITGQRLDVPPHGLDPETLMVDKRETFIADCAAKKYHCLPSRRRAQARKKKQAKRRQETTQN
jgi:hypothetical protein